MPSPEIPQEIIDCIIGELQYQPRALVACSLVSHSFVPTSQRLLFSTLCLTSSKRSATLCQMLFKSFQVNPYLAHLVEDLSFQLDNSMFGAHNTAFPPILRSLSHLRSFTLSGTQAIKWHEAPGYQRVSLGAILHLPYLESVTISNILYFPMSLFTRSTQLKRLSLLDTTAASPNLAETEPLNPTPRKGQLEYLFGGEGAAAARTTHTLVNFLAHQSSQLGVSQLRQFTASVWWNEGVRAYQTAFNSSGKSLENLALSVGHPDNHPPLDTLSIGPLRHLRRLSVSIFEHASSPKWLLHLIASASEHNMIEEISINTFSVDFGDVSWGQLDAVLTSAKFKCLRSIVLRYWKQHIRGLLPEKQFPRLLARSTFTVYHECDRVFPRNH
ncbi:hypothetical protein BDZ94DRAFT_1311744 [Collybia nuda]|uniref:Uncharacterized protein n=1 Tax=Collybia nuda TaxID=64659 RepID=A0A9P5Y0P9_9AGAR|nr:hypothetical protein BDZ94DRAFT_1311744 [Collybia nuda]